MAFVLFCYNTRGFSRQLSRGKNKSIIIIMTQFMTPVQCTLLDSTSCILYIPPLVPAVKKICPLSG
jgi:hypothetical protein